MMRGPAPSQNRFARSTAFIHSQTVEDQINGMEVQEEEANDISNESKHSRTVCAGKIKGYLINHNLVPCAKNSNLRHCHVEDTELQNPSRWLILRHDISELV